MNFTKPVDTLSLSELAGQCLMPRLDIDRFTNEPEYRDGAIKLVEEGGVGGFCIFGGNPESVSQSLSGLQSVASVSHRVPLIYSADCEFGLPMRLKAGGTEFPDAMAIAKTGKLGNSFEVGKAIGLEMKSLGLHWNFAPVADVNSNPANPIINTRAFGEDPETVIAYAAEFMRGTQAAGIAATAKHFPGHGDTSVDSHRELPIVLNDAQGFDRLELPPFRALVTAGIDSIMPGHLAAPKLALSLAGAAEEQYEPATLSRTLITTLLRERMAFEGVVVTDAMEMEAITKRYGQSDASARAMLAGVDILLLTPDATLARKAIERTVEDGHLAMDQLRRRVSRIMGLKERYVTSESFSTVQELYAMSGTHSKLALSVAREAIELRGKLPDTPLDLLILCDDREQTAAKAKRFAGLVTSRFRNVSIRSDAPDELLPGKQTVIATLHRARGYIGGTTPEASVPAMLLAIAKRMDADRVSPAGLIEFGSPYLNRLFTQPLPYLLKTYSECRASVEAVASILLS